MPLDIAYEANAIVDHLTQGRIDALCKNYAFPAAIYFGSDVLILRNEDDFHEALQVFRSVLVDAGLGIVSTEVLDLTSTEGLGFTVTVSNRYYTKSGQEIGTADVRYFVQSDWPCPKIRLVEYTSWPCSDTLARHPEFRELLHKSENRIGALDRTLF